MNSYDKTRLEELTRERDLYLKLGYKLTAAARQRAIDEIKS